MKAIPIIHLHGTIGRLPWQGDSSRPYSRFVTPETIELSAEGIRVIHESTANDATFKAARALLAAADSVIFLGFGYHADNLDRIGFKSIPTTKIQGTCFGLTGREKNDLDQRLESRISLAATGHDIMAFFRNEAHFD
jgi:hypothetical protein